MTVIVTIQVTDDKTGEVKKVYVQPLDMPYKHPFDTQKEINDLMRRVFVDVYESEGAW
jgi:hypothetical protein